MRYRIGTTLIYACALAAGAANSADFSERRISGLDFEAVPAAEAFVKIATQAGMVVTLEDCPPADARVSARAVSGRLPVVLDRLTAALGCTWRERAGVVYIHGKAGSPSARLPAAPVSPVGKEAEKAATAPAAIAQPAPDTVPSASDGKASTGVAAGVAIAAITPPALPTTTPSVTLRLGGADIPTYALRDFLHGHGLALVWGAGDVGSVTAIAGDYTGDTPLAAVDALLRAHGLHGVYARSNKTLYVR